MQNVIAAFNSSIQFNKKNFWIDPVTHNQYYVGVQYAEGDIGSIETLLDIPITSTVRPKPISLRSLVTIARSTVPTEVKHYNIQPTIELTMGVQGRDLGHVSDDIVRILNGFGSSHEFEESTWTAYDPSSRTGRFWQARRSCSAASMVECNRRSATWPLA